MKKTAIVFVLVLAATAAAVAREKPVGGVHHFTELAPDVYLAEPRFGGANSTIIITGEGVVVVDAQNSPASASILIEEIGRLTDKKVVAVVNSHWHGDHHGGNAAFLKAYPDVRIIAHTKTSRDIEAVANKEIQRFKTFFSGLLEPARKIVGQEAGQSSLPKAQIEQIKRYIALEESFLSGITEDFEYALPNELLDREQITLRYGGTEIEIRHPGKAHTEGDLFVYLPKERILVTGDLLTVPYVVPRSGFPKAYAEVLRDLAKIKFKKLVPGHGTVLKDDKLLKLMADLMSDVHLLARSHANSGISEEEGIAAAKGSEKLRKYEKRIDWNDERGLKFLNYESLVQMTYLMARKELGK